MGYAIAVDSKSWLEDFGEWLGKCIAKLQKKPEEGKEIESAEITAAGVAATVTKIGDLTIPLTPYAAKIRSIYYRSKGDDQAIQMTLAQVIAETASLGQIDMTLGGWWKVPGTQALMRTAEECHRAPFEYSMKPLLQRFWLNSNKPLIPDVGTLSELRARNRLTDLAYKSWMGQQGFPSWAADLTAYAKTKMPGFADLLSLLRRGFINADTFRAWLQRGAVDPDVVSSLELLRWDLPGYQDLIGVYMREGYLAEKWVEIPEEFTAYMKQLGYSSEWSKRLWGKHWVLPGVNLLYDMLHKNIIDGDTMALMLRYHDFEPVWRQRLIDNAYNMIPRVDLRRAYMYGSLAATELKQRYEWLGYKPADAAVMADIARRFSLQRYYTRLETVARSAFRKGQIEILGKINIPAEAIALVIEAETLARAASVLDPMEEARVLSASQVLRLYQLQIRGRTWVHSRLEGQGFTAEDAALLIQLYEPRIEAVEINRDLITASSALYKEGLMAPEEYQGRLRKAGLSESEITAKKEAEDLRYRLDYAKDLITLAKEAYRKDVYTLEEFTAYLLGYGLQRERAAALVALEQLRKIPKPKPGAA